MVNRDPFRDFIESLDSIQLDPSSQPRPVEDQKDTNASNTQVKEPIRVYLTRKDNDYYVNCVPVSRSNELQKEDILSNPIGREHVLLAKDLPEVCSALELALESTEYIKGDRRGIGYHRDPPIMPTPNQLFVRYRLVASEKDVGSNKLYGLLIMKVLPVLETSF